MTLLIGDTIPDTPTKEQPRSYEPSSCAITPRGFQCCTPQSREGTPGRDTAKPRLGAEELPRARLAGTPSSTGAARLLVELDVNQDIHLEALAAHSLQVTPLISPQLASLGEGGTPQPKADSLSGALPRQRGWRGASITANRP